MTDKKTYIAYYRVSTNRQGVSGLGLESQRQTVKEFIKDDTLIIAEYTEVESGKKKDRPELLKAIEHAKNTGSRLVVAKLDRLARNVSFVSSLRESGVDFVCADMPDANSLTIHIISAIAEMERDLISKRTKDALKVARQRGVELGSPGNLTKTGRKKGSKRMKEIASQNSKQSAALIKQIVKNGNATLQSIADILNDNGFRTAKGKEFNPIQVSRIMKRERISRC